MAAVLAKVQKELGAQAHIASAQKARTGGIMGFFQRERYEVIVDLPEPGAPQASPSSAPVAAQASDTEVDALHESDALDPDTDVEEGAEPQARPATSLLDLAEQANRTERKPALSTETGSFADVLSRVAFQADMQSDPIASVIADRPKHIDAIPERPVPQELLPEQSPSPIRTRVTDLPLAKLGLPALYIPVDVDPALMNRALVAALESLPKAPEVRPAKGSVIAVVGERNEALEIAATLSEKWNQPTEQVVLASQSYKGRSTNTVVRTTESAYDASRSWKRRNKPTIVAVDAAPGSQDALWAKHVLAALEPVATYGVADATRKAEDVASWAQVLGGIDCLAVNNIDHTVSPASMIATGIPIDRIDGRKATSSYWAMLLLERLEAATTAP